MTDLPPRPDPKTGEPRPPAAPAQYQGAEAEKEPSHVPAAPEGQGPVLAYYRESKRSAWLSAPLPVAVLLGLAVWHGGLAALSSWFTWLIACIVVAFIVYKGRSDVLTAGADWVQFNNHWVRTYELVSVRYVARAMGTRFALVFKDKERSVEVPLWTLQANKRLWAYVYLGIRHSVANGAEVNRAARTQFPDLAGESPRSATNEQ